MSPLNELLNGEKKACIRHADLDVRVRECPRSDVCNVWGHHGGKVVFEKLTSPKIITWNVMIGAIAESGGSGGEAYRLFLHMHSLI